MTKPSTPHRDLPPSRLVALTLLAAAGVVPAAAPAAGDVSAVEITEAPATPSDYTIGNTTFEWGLGTNLLLDAFVADGERYLPARSAQRTEIRRVDRAGVAEGSPCGLFAETLDAAGTRLAPDFPALADGNCDTAALLASDLVNRGVLDLFSNRPPTAKNVERVDFLFDTGLNAPFDPAGGALAGHLVGDKSGNNALQMAAVLALDDSGLPAAYGPLVRIGALRCTDPDICYGSVGLTEDYAFLQSAPLPPHGPPAPLARFTEPVGLAYVSAGALGLGAGQRYHGVSLFADDVDPAVHDLLDTSTFPADTVDRSRDVAGDSVDLHGGGSRHYIAEAASVATGRVACSVPGGTRGVGITGIDVTVHVDTDGDGVLDADRDPPLGDAVASAADGRFDVPALADGSYFLRLDTDDPDIPDGASLASADTLPFVITGNDVASLDFLLDCPDLAAPPTAVADVVELEQSAPGVPVGEATIDVLGNDLDPLGQGLIVAAITAAGRGEVALAEDDSGVLYTPEVGFDGDDTFDYTLEDGAGRQATGTVAVSVSLIPGEDPDCVEGGRIDGCEILTELDGHGFGRVQTVSLVALLAVLLGRGRRRFVRAAPGERS